MRNNVHVREENMQAPAVEGETFNEGFDTGDQESIIQVVIGSPHSICNAIYGQLDAMAVLAGLG